MRYYSYHPQLILVNQASEIAAEVFSNELLSGLLHESPLEGDSATTRRKNLYVSPIRLAFFSFVSLAISHDLFTNLNWGWYNFQ